MSALSTAEDGRRLAESLMVDECIVRERGGGAPVYDPVTDDTTVPVGVTVYVGECQVRSAGRLQGRDVDAAEQVVTISGYIVRLPFRVANVVKGHLVTVTRSQDPALVDVTLLVSEVQGSTYGTARRLICDRDLG